MRHQVRFTLLLAAMLFGCRQVNNETMAQTMKIYITIDGQTRTVTLADNNATQALVEALRQQSISYEAHDYGGFEKVGALGRSLPTSNRQMTTTPGDIVLYNGDQLVIFYGSNSWSYTPIGSIDGATVGELKDFLKAGQGNVSVELSLNTTTGLHTMQADSQNHGKRYALNGVQASNSAKGIYIENGKKILK